MVYLVGSMLWIHLVYSRGSLRIYVVDPGGSMWWIQIVLVLFSTQLSEGPQQAKSLHVGANLHC